MKKTIHLIFNVALLALLISCSMQDKQETDWEKLLSGNDFTGWHQIGGEANYEISDGVITGKTVLNTPNSFMVTDKKYSDFILEFEVMNHELLNTGVQIRSNSIPEYNDGHFHGYQVEIEDPARDRNWTGGIYDEARRGWIYPLDNNPEARKAYKKDEWNTIRIEAVGDTIKTWVNGIPAAHLIDNMTTEGHIGLQVHGIGDNKEKEDIWVKWRNIKIMTDSEAIKKNVTPTPVEPQIYQYNVLSEKEKKEGWQLLFDGKTTEGWRGAYMDHFPEKGWIVHNAAITVLESGGAESKHGGDIVTKDEYTNFELQADFRLTKGANSGIKYYVTEKEENNPGSAYGLEYQILDDEHHPDAKKGRNGNRTLSSLYDMIPAPEDKPVKETGKWNHARIYSSNDTVIYYLNGEKLIDFVRGSDHFRELVEISKYSAPRFNTHNRFGEAEKGHILLQDHGNRVSFRNIKIKKLN